MSAAPTSHHDQHVRRNFVCHCLEGGLYMGGLAFLQPETVMPKMVESLHGSSLIISIMPAVLAATFAFAGLFVSPKVEQMRHFKGWVLGFGLLQRLPYLVAGLVLWYSEHLEGWILPVVVLTPVLSGLIGGVGVVAWMEMVTRMVPKRIRAAGWAARYIMQAVIGMGAGAVIHQVLTQFPGHRGYAVLHLIAFGFLFLSWLSQLPMKESEHPVHMPPRDPQPYLTYLKELPGMLAAQPNLLRLILVRFSGMGYLMLVSFLTLHALKVTGSVEADVGRFVSLQNVGTILGSLLAAWLGYHSGGKVLLVVSRLICAPSVGAANSDCSAVLAGVLPFISSRYSFASARLSDRPRSTRASASSMRPASFRSSTRWVLALSSSYVLPRPNDTDTYASPNDAGASGENRSRMSIKTGNRYCSSACL